MSTPADRIRRALGFCHQRFWSQKVKAIKDAASAIAELERERDRHAEVREIITSVVCGALNRAGINEVDNPGVAIDAIRNRAENAERERDELRAKLSEYEQAPTVAWLATQQQRNPSQCVVTTKLDGWDHVELIARPTRKGE